ncbi:MAG: carbohydrate kinase family protein, partial [Anaerolineales bacterium]|nr:carbohydrate kinase family protein [Anaerolineales bacterium]
MQNVSSSLDVVVVGNAGVDTNVYFYTDEIDFSVEANFTQNVDYVGQAGGYGARGFAQLGKRTAFIGAVGDDPNGGFVRGELARDGVDLTGVFYDPAGTARSINFMYKDGRRKNFYDGKGHMVLHPDLEVCRAVLGRARLAHFNIPNWARELLPLARELGLTISCDIQDVVSPDDPYRQDFIREADILFFSAANFADPTPLIHRFLAEGPARVVVAGMGARGCLLGTREGVRAFGPVSLPEPVVD